MTCTPGKNYYSSSQASLNIRPSSLMRGGFGCGCLAPPFPSARVGRVLNLISSASGCLRPQFLQRRHNRWDQTLPLSSAPVTPVKLDQCARLPRRRRSADHKDVRKYLRRLRQDVSERPGGGSRFVAVVRLRSRAQSDPTGDT